MSSDLANVFLLSLVAMANPTLLAAVTVMLLLPSPKRLLLGYVLGAYTTSVTLGLVIVFSLPRVQFGEHLEGHGQPGRGIVVGVLAWAIAFVLGTGATHRCGGGVSVAGRLSRRPERRRSRGRSGCSVGGQRGLRSWWGRC